MLQACIACIKLPIYLFYYNWTNKKLSTLSDVRVKEKTPNQTRNAVGVALGHYKRIARKKNELLECKLLATFRINRKRKKDACIQLEMDHTLKG